MYRFSRLYLDMDIMVFFPIVALMYADYRAAVVEMVGSKCCRNGNSSLVSGEHELNGQAKEEIVKLSETNDAEEQKTE